MSSQVVERDGPAKVKSQHDEGFRYVTLDRKCPLFSDVRRWDRISNVSAVLHFPDFDDFIWRIRSQNSLQTG